jgi:hypothetical protein
MLIVETNYRNANTNYTNTNYTNTNYTNTNYININTNYRKSSLNNLKQKKSLNNKLFVNMIVNKNNSIKSKENIRKLFKI